MGDGGAGACGILKAQVQTLLDVVVFAAEGKG
jgi:hypothetical protein